MNHVSTTCWRAAKSMKDNTGWKGDWVKVYKNSKEKHEYWKEALGTKQQHASYYLNAEKYMYI